MLEKELKGSDKLKEILKRHYDSYIAEMESRIEASEKSISGGGVPVKRERTCTLLDPELIGLVFEKALNDKEAFEALKKVASLEYTVKSDRLPSRISQYNKKPDQTDEQFILEDPLYKELLEAYQEILKASKELPQVQPPPKELPSVKVPKELAHEREPKKVLHKKEKKHRHRKEPKELRPETVFKEMPKEPVPKKEKVLKEVRETTPLLKKAPREILPQKSKNNPLIFQNILKIYQQELSNFWNKKVESHFVGQDNAQLNAIAGNKNLTPLEQLKELINLFYRRGFGVEGEASRLVPDLVTTYLVLVNPGFDEYKTFILFLCETQKRKDVVDSVKDFNWVFMQSLLITKAEQLNEFNLNDFNPEKLSELESFAALLEELKAYGFGDKSDVEKRFIATVSDRIKGIPAKEAAKKALEAIAEKAGFMKEAREVIEFKDSHIKDSYIEASQDTGKKVRENADNYRKLRTFTAKGVPPKFSSGIDALNFILRLHEIQEQNQLPADRIDKEFLEDLKSTAIKMISEEKDLNKLDEIVKVLNLPSSKGAIDLDPESLIGKFWSHLLNEKLHGLRGPLRNDVQSVFEVVEGISNAYNLRNYNESLKNNLQNAIFEIAYTELEKLGLWPEYEQYGYARRIYKAGIFALIEKSKAFRQETAQDFIYYTLQKKLKAASNPAGYEQVIKVALQLEKKGFTFGGKNQEEQEKNKSLFLGEALAGYGEYCRNLAEYKACIKFVINEVSGNVMPLFWDTSLAVKINSFDEYKALMETVESFCTSGKNQENAKKIRGNLLNAANIVAGNLSGPDKEAFLEFISVHEIKDNKVFLNAANRKALETVGYTLEIYHGQGIPKHVKKNTLSLYVTYEDKKETLRYIYTDFEGKSYFNVLDPAALKPYFDEISKAATGKSYLLSEEARKALFNAAKLTEKPKTATLLFSPLLKKFWGKLAGRHTLLGALGASFEVDEEDKKLYRALSALVHDPYSTEERRCKNILAFLYPKIGPKGTEAEWDLFMDMAMTFVVAQKEPKQFQSLIYFLYDMGAKRLLRDLLVLKAQSLQMPDELKQFSEFLSTLRNKYRIYGEEKAEDFPLNNEIIQLSSLIEKQSYNALQNLKPAALSLRFFRTEKYDENDWRVYFAFIDSLAEAIKNNKLEADEQFAKRLFAIGIEEALKPRTGFDNIYQGAVSERADRFLIHLGDLRKRYKEYPFPPKATVLSITEDVLFHQMQFLEPVFRANDIEDLIRKLGQIRNYLNAEERSAEFNNRLFVEGLKKLQLTPPEALGQGLALMYDQLFVLGSERLPFEGWAKFTQEFFVRAVDTYRKERLDKKNPNRYIEFINGLYPLWIKENPDFKKELTPIKEPLNPIIKSTLSDWVNSVSDAKGYVVYIEYINKTAWLKDDQIPGFEPGKLNQLLKTSADYKIILQALLQAKEPTALVNDQIAFLIKNAPVTSIAVIHELKSENKISQGQHDHAAKVLQTAIEQYRPLLRNLLGEWEVNFLIQEAKSDSRREALDKAILQLNLAPGSGPYKVTDLDALSNAYISFAGEFEKFSAVFESKNITHLANKRFIHHIFTLFMLLPKPSVSVFERNIEELCRYSLEDKSGRLGYLINDLLIFRAQSLRTQDEFATFGTFLEKLRNEKKFPEQTINTILDALPKDVSNLGALNALRPAQALAKFHTPAEAKKFIENLFELKKSYQLSDDQMDRNLLMKILAEGAAQTSKIKKLSSIASAPGKDFDVKQIFSKEADEFFNLLDRLLLELPVDFSDAEKAHIRDCQYKILIEQAGFAITLNLDQRLGVLKWLYDFRKNNQLTALEPVNLLFEIGGGQHISLPNLLEKALSQVDMKSEFGQQFILYVLNRVSGTKAKYPVAAERFESFLGQLDSQVDVEKVRDCFNRALGEYLKKCSRVEPETARLDAYKRFSSFMLYSLNKHKPDPEVDAGLWIQIAEKLNWSEYHQLVTDLEEKLEKQKDSPEYKSSQNMLKDFMVATLPIIKNKLQPAEEIGFSNFIDKLNEFTFSEKEAQEIDQVSKPVLKKRLDEEKAKLPLRWGELETKVTQLLQETKDTLGYLEGVGDYYKASLPILTKLEDFQVVVKEAYPKMLESIEDLDKPEATSAHLSEAISKANTILSWIGGISEHFTKNCGEFTARLKDEITTLETESKNRYVEAQKNFQQLKISIENIRVEREELNAKKNQKLADLKNKANKDPTGYAKATKEIEDKVTLLNQALTEKEERLQSQRAELEIIANDLGMLFEQVATGKDKPLVKTHLLKVKEFEEMLSAMKTDLEPPIAMWKAMDQALKEGDVWLETVGVQETTYQKEYEETKASYIKALMFAKEQQARLWAFRDESEQQLAKFNFSNLEIDKNSKAELLGSEERVKQAFPQLDRSLKQMDIFIGDAETQFKTYEGIESYLPENQEKLKGFSEQMTNSRTQFENQKTLIEEQLGVVRETLEGEAKNVSKNFAEYIETKLEEETKWKKAIADREVELKRIEEEEVNLPARDTWLEEVCDVPADVDIGNLEIRQELVERIVRSTEEECAEFRVRGLTAFQEMQTVAREMLPRVKGYCEEIDKVLADNVWAVRRTKLALALFSWLPLDVAPWEKFVEEQNKLDAYAKQLRGIEAQAQELTNLANPFEILPNELIDKTEELTKSINNLYIGGEAHKLVTSLSEEWLEGREKQRNWWNDEAREVREKTESLVKHLGQWYGQRVQEQEMNEILVPAKEEQSRLDQLSKQRSAQVRLLSDIKEAASQDLSKTRNEIAQLQAGQKMFENAWMAEQRKETFSQKYSEYVAKAAERKQSPLSWVLLQNNMSPDDKQDTLRRLAEMDKDKEWLNKPDNEGRTPLYIAVQQGQLPLVKLLVEELKADINVRNNKKSTPLWRAIWSCQTDIVDYLIKKGAHSVNCQKFLGDWVQHNDVEKVSWLLAERKRQQQTQGKVWIEVDVNALVLEKDGVSRSPLQIAIQKGSLDLVKGLLEHGADVNVKVPEKEGVSLLHIAIQKGSSLDLIKGLLEHRADANVKVPEKEGVSLLHIVIQKGSLDLVKGLLEHGANANVKVSGTDGVSRSLLQIAIREGSVELVKLLLKHGADVNAQDSINNPVFYYAAEKKNDEILNLLLAHRNINLNLKKGSSTILHMAAEQNRVGLVKLLLEAGPRLDIQNEKEKGTSLNINIERDETKDTPLHLAARKGHIEVARLLLKAGAKLDVKNKMEQKPFDEVEKSQASKVGQELLREAVKSGEIDLVKRLVDEGGVQVPAGRVGKEPSLLFLAHGSEVDATRKELIKYLTEKKATFDETEVDNENNNLLHLASKSGDVEMVKRLSKVEQTWYGSITTNTDSQNKARDTALHLASAGKLPAHLEVVTELLEKKADMNIQNEALDTPLHVALRNGNLEITNLLLEKGADVKKQNKAQETTLHLAVEQVLLHPAVEQKDVVEQEALLEKLVSKGVDINALNNKGETALYMAVRSENEKIAKWLLDKGAEVNKADEDKKWGWEPILHFAVKQNNLGLVQTLLLKGANVNSSNGTWETALHLAVKQENMELVKELLSKGVDVNRSNRSGETALHLAVAQKNMELVDELLSNGANVDKTNDAGKTALHLAVNQNQPELMKKLIQKGARLEIGGKNRGYGYYGDYWLGLAKEKRGEGPFDTLHGRKMFNDWVGSTKDITEATRDQLVAQGGGEYLLYLAIEQGNTSLVKWLVEEKKVDVNGYDPEGRTLLSRLSDQPGRFAGLEDKCPLGDMESLGVKTKGELAEDMKTAGVGDKSKRRVYMEYLIQKGARYYEVQDKSGNTALHLFAKTGVDYDLVQQLVKGLWIDLGVEEAKRTAKKYLIGGSARTPSTDEVLNAQNSQRETLLHLVIEKGEEGVDRTDLVKCLVLEKGVRLDLVNAEGKEPFELNEAIGLDQSDKPLKEKIDEHRKATKIKRETEEAAKLKKRDLFATQAEVDLQKKPKVREPRQLEERPAEPPVLKPTSLTLPQEQKLSQPSTQQFVPPLFSQPPVMSFEEALKKGEYEITKDHLTKNPKYKDSPGFKALPKLIRQYLLTEREDLKKKGLEFSQAYVELNQQLRKAILEGRSVEVEAWFDERIKRRDALKKALNEPEGGSVREALEKLDFKGSWNQINKAAKRELEVLNYQIFKGVNMVVDEKDESGLTLLGQLINRENEPGWNEKTPKQRQLTRQDDAKIIRILMEHLPKEKLPKETPLEKLALYDLLDKVEIGAPGAGERAELSEEEQESDEEPVVEKPEKKSLYQKAKEAKARFAEGIDTAKGKVVKTGQEIVKKVKEAPPPENLIMVYEKNKNKSDASDVSEEEKKAGKYDLYVMAWSQDVPPTRDRLDKKFAEETNKLLKTIPAQIESLEEAFKKTAQTRKKNHQEQLRKIEEQLKKIEEDAKKQLQEQLNKVEGDAKKRLERQLNKEKNNAKKQLEKQKKELEKQFKAQTNQNEVYQKAQIQELIDRLKELKEGGGKPKMPMMVRYGDRLWFYGNTPGGRTLLEPIGGPEHGKSYDTILPEKGYDLVMLQSQTLEGLEGYNAYKQDPLRRNEFRVSWDKTNQTLDFKVPGSSGDISANISRKELEESLGKDKYEEFLGVVEEAAKTNDSEKLKPYFPKLLEITTKNYPIQEIKKVLTKDVPPELYEEISAIKGHSHGMVSAELKRGKGVRNEMSKWIIKEIEKQEGGEFKKSDIDVEDKQGNTLLHLAVRDNQDVMVKWLLPTSLQEDLGNWFERTKAKLKGEGVKAAGGQIGAQAGQVAGGVVGTVVAGVSAPVLGPIGVGLGVVAGKAVAAVGEKIGETIAETIYGITSEHIPVDLAQTIDVYKTNKAGDTPLHIAAATTVEKNLWIVAALLAKTDKTGKLNIRNNAGDTPLHVAVRHRNAHIVSLLILDGADINIPDADGMTALHLAAINGDETLFEMLVENGANMYARTKLGLTVADLILKKIDLLNEEISNTPIEDKQSLEDKRDRYLRMGDYLSGKKETKSLDSIIATGKDKDKLDVFWDVVGNIKSRLGKIGRGDEKAVAKAQDAKSEEWNTLGAAAKKREERLEQPPKDEQTGNTILHVLVQNSRNYKLVNELLSNYDVKDLNQPNKQGNTPLHLAVLAGNRYNAANQQMINLLREKGADPDLKNHKGKTPFGLAEESKKIVWYALFPNTPFPKAKEKLEEKGKEELPAQKTLDQSAVYPPPLSPPNGKSSGASSTKSTSSSDEEQRPKKPSEKSTNPFEDEEFKPGPAPKEKK